MTYTEIFDAFYSDSTDPILTNGQKRAWGVLKDLTDRRGLRQAWEEIDPEIQNEIFDSWAKICS